MTRLDGRRPHQSRSQPQAAVPRRPGPQPVSERSDLLRDARPREVSRRPLHRQRRHAHGASRRHRPRPGTRDGAVRTSSGAFSVASAGGGLRRRDGGIVPARSRRRSDFASSGPPPLSLALVRALSRTSLPVAIARLISSRSWRGAGAARHDSDAVRENEGTEGTVFTTERL